MKTFTALRWSLAMTFLALTTAMHPAQAQPKPGFQSDISGPNLHSLTSVKPLPDVAVPVQARAGAPASPIPIIMIQIALPTGDTGSWSNLLDAVVDFNSSMDSLLPFGGCTNVNWRSYNKALKASKKLSLALKGAVQSQRKKLAANPTADELAQTQKRVKAIEDTTAALEKATTTLAFLEKVMNRAR